LLLGAGGCVDHFPEAVEIERRDAALTGDADAGAPRPDDAVCTTGPPPSVVVPTVARPEFIGVAHIDIEDIARISRFRSGVGHDYNDTFEYCRSMKHYFTPRDGVLAADIEVRSPMAATVVDVKDEAPFGTRVLLRSNEYPDVIVVLFHVALDRPLTQGEVLVAGQRLGSHATLDTNHDIAVGITVPSGWRLVSYFEVIDATLLKQWLDAGVPSRDDMIVTQEERDDDALCCIEDQFATSSSLADWVDL
jgi:hypothetical protein